MKNLLCWNCGDILTQWEIKEQDEENRKHGANPEDQREYYLCNDCNHRREEMQEDYRTATEWGNENPAF